MSVPQKSHPDLLQTVHRLLGSTILITLTDGRTAQGKFLCLDRLGNIILDNAVEKREIAYCSSAGNDSNPGDETIYRWDTERLLTQAVIPGERLFKVQIARKEYEKRLGNLNP
jgi:small nuclear ribonucleoprotein (snRNP)-like protein